MTCTKSSRSLNFVRQAERVPKRQSIEMLEQKIVRTLGIMLLLQFADGRPAEQPTDTLTTAAQQQQAMTAILQDIDMQATTFGQLAINSTRAICTNMVKQLKAMPEQSDALQEIIAHFTGYLRQTDNLEECNLKSVEHFTKTYTEIWLDCLQVAKKTNLLTTLAQAMEQADIAKSLMHIQEGVRAFAKKFDAQLEKIFNEMSFEEQEKYADMITLYRLNKTEEPSIEAFNNFVKKLRVEYDKTIYEDGNN